MDDYIDQILAKDRKEKIILNFILYTWIIVNNQNLNYYIAISKKIKYREEMKTEMK